MSDAEHDPVVAYVFPRFPDFTQTFCAREILELDAQGAAPLVFSIQDTREGNVGQFPHDLYERVIYLPPADELRSIVRDLVKQGQLPKRVGRTLRLWKYRRSQNDRRRVFEAAWIGWYLQKQNVRYVHTHFAGLGARCCWWINKFYGIPFGFTGHANDIFAPNAFPISLGKLVSSAALVITVSDYSATYLKRKFWLSRQKVHRVYNSLDVEAFGPVAEARVADEAWRSANTILAVGRLIEKKGYPDLISACALLRERGVPDLQCIIAGDGPLMDELQAQIEAYGLKDIVHLLGARDQTEIKALMESASLFSLPCVIERAGGKDNLPTVLMEAMASGLACVSTSIAGVPEMIVDQVTGLLVPEHAPQRLADAMEKLLRDPDLAATMAAAGRARAVDLFAQRKNVAQLRRLQLSVLS